MKKWLKSEICGSHEQYTVHGRLGQQLRLEKKKKKEEKVENVERGKRRRANALS